MRLVLTYNAKTSDDQSQAERFDREYVDRLLEGLRRLGHEVIPLEVSGPPGAIVDGLVQARPELVFNLAEGTSAHKRESYYPAMFELLGLPHTGGATSLLHVGLDKRLTNKILAVRGLQVPGGALLTPEEHRIPDQLRYPLFIKPNYEGSSMGISQKSVVESEDEARPLIDELLARYPAGVDIEEYIAGRELTVPMLQAYPQRLLEIVEYSFPGGGHAIFDYETKARSDQAVETHCPPALTTRQRDAVLALAEQAFRVLRPRDFGRADIRLTVEGTAYLIEFNPLPGLRPVSPVITGAEAKGIDYEGVLELIVESAVRRYGLRAEPSGEA